jgi:hypothetical protein
MTRPGSEGLAGRTMRHVVEQRRLVYRGREFHFVSYDGLPANPKRGEPATAPAWWLMSSGTRWEVMPFQPGAAQEELDRRFTEWLDANVFDSPKTRGGE